MARDDQPQRPSPMSDTRSSRVIERRMWVYFFFGLLILIVAGVFLLPYFARGPDVPEAATPTVAPSPPPAPSVTPTLPPVTPPPAVTPTPPAAPPPTIP